MQIVCCGNYLFYVSRRQDYVANSLPDHIIFKEREKNVSRFLNYLVLTKPLKCFRRCNSELNVFTFCVGDWRTVYDEYVQRPVHPDDLSIHNTINLHCLKKKEEEESAAEVNA